MLLNQALQALLLISVDIMPRARSNRGGQQRQSLEETMQALATKANGEAGDILEKQLGIEALDVDLTCR